MSNARAHPGCASEPVWSGHLPRVPRPYVAVLALISALVFAATAWAAVTYFGPGHRMAGGATASTAGYAPRAYNKVWRPIGELFRLSYGGTALSNATANPFVDTRDARYAKAFCSNLESHVVDPVTCQT